MFFAFALTFYLMQISSGGFKLVAKLLGLPELVFNLFLNLVFVAGLFLHELSFCFCKCKNLSDVLF